MKDNLPFQWSMDNAPMVREREYTSGGFVGSVPEEPTADSWMAAFLIDPHGFDKLPPVVAAVVGDTLPYVEEEWLLFLELFASYHFIRGVGVGREARP